MVGRDRIQLRGQILYRVAEMMEGRRAQFETELADAGAADPARGVSASIDRWVWYAGWADKLAQVVGATNPVAGPYFNFTMPEPTGVVGHRRARATSRCSGSSRGWRRRS